MEYKTVPSLIKTVDDRTVVGYPAIAGNIDSGGDRIFKGAFKKTIKDNLARVRHLWQHDFSSPPIAKIVSLREVPAEDLPVEIRQQFPEVTAGLELTREYLRTPRADEILEGIKADVITEMSFGYDPIKYDFEEVDEKSEAPFGLVRNLHELRLWDTSDVNWGMNPATVASKMVVPYKDTGKADEGMAWAAPTLGDFTSESFEDLSEGEKRRIANHYAWAESMPPGNFGALKLPHHQAGTSGVGKVVWSGVRSAMSVLMGGMGGVDVPEGDRRGIYTHLAKHYAAFEKEPPDFKVVEMSSLIIQVGSIEPYLVKTGRVLSKRNLERLKDALAVLQEILLAAEPPEDEEQAQALTASILRKLAMAERDPIYIMSSRR